jgi:hypothetical protein
MKTQVIEIPEGKMIDKITYKDIPSLPEKWEDINEIEGYYIDEDSNIRGASKCAAIFTHKNIFSTQEEAKAALALAQLTQLRKIYRDGWMPDYDDIEQEKYIIGFTETDFYVYKVKNPNGLLCFQTRELANSFLINFTGLILEAKPLLT